MATQTITIPASTLFADTDSQKRYDTNDADSIELNRDLYTYITDMSITRWTRRFIAETDPDGFEFRMILGRSGTWPTGQMGDDLDPEWETNGSALAFAQGSFSVTGVPGPDHPDNFLQDSGETYRWIVAGDIATALEQFFFTDLDTSADFQMTFSTDAEGAHSVALGAANWSFDVPTLSFDHDQAHMRTLAAAAWSFDVPQLQRTHGRTTQNYQRTLGAASWSFRAELFLPAPAVPVVSAMLQWVRSLRLPWTEIERRLALTEAIADVMQRPVDEAGIALRELWPATCRAETLQVWGEVLELPQREGETAADWRRRLARRRREPVGESGWIKDEVQRITGDDPPRVIEFPRQGMRWGYSRWGDVRWGIGPLLIVGVEPEHRAAVELALENGTEVEMGINYVSPAVFDAI